MASVLGIDLNSLWWSACQSLLEIVDTVGDCFDFLVGKAEVSPEANAGQGGDINNLFVDLFKNSENGSSFTKMYFSIFLGSMVFFGMLIVIGAIKAQFSKEPGASLSQIGFKGFFAFLKMLIIPAVFLVALQATGAIFNFLIGVMSDGAKTDGLANAICNACAPASKSVRYDMSFDEMADIIGDSDNFSYMLCILSACFLLVTLVTVCISLVKRIIEVFFYYLAAPIAIARTPIDDGKSYEQWKDNVIAKLLSAGGIIICMYLYYALIGKFTAAVDGWTAGSLAVKNMLKILFIIGGSMVPASASMLMAQLISQGAGQNEANNMMHTQQMMGNALRSAGLAGGKVLGSALTAGGGVGKGIVGSLLGSRGGSGAGSVANTAAAALSSSATSKTPTLNNGSAAAKALTGTGASGGVATSAANASGSSGATGSSGFAADPRVKGRSIAGNFLRASTATGRNYLAKNWSNPGKQGFLNKTGMLIGAGALMAGGVAVGAAAGIGKGVANIIGGKRGAEKARHTKHNRQEKAQGEQMLAQFASENSRQGGQQGTLPTSTRTNEKWAKYNAAVAQDRRHGSSSRVDGYIGAKMGFLERRRQTEEGVLASMEKRSGVQLTPKQKQEYMNLKLGDQYRRYGGYLQQAREGGHLSEDQLRGYEERFRKIGASMGISPTSSAEGGDKK